MTWDTKRFAALAKNDRVRKAVIAAAILGVALIVLSEVLPQKRTTQSEEPTTSPPKTAAEYADELETRLCHLVGGIDGVGACRVMVTLENGVEYVYASEEKAGSDYSADGDRLSQADDSETSVILVQTEDGYEGLLVTELQPTVKGVVVVCAGGGDEAVRQRVTEAVTTVLNITAKRVCVVAGSGEG